MKARRRREKFCGRVGCTLVFCGVLEDTFGAYDAAGVRAVLVDRREEVDRKLAEVGAAPPSFLSLLAANVNDAGGVASPAGARHQQPIASYSYHISTSRREIRPCGGEEILPIHEARLRIEAGERPIR